MEWLKSTHTSPVGTATLDFCDSRGLSQLFNFPTRDTAILDLALSEHDSGITVYLYLILTLQIMLQC